MLQHSLGLQILCCTIFITSRQIKIVFVSFSLNSISKWDISSPEYGRMREGEEDQQH